MYEFKYKITDADMKKVNRDLMWLYVIPYLSVAAAGLAAGIVAIVMSARTELYVMGIILVVLSAILLLCALMLMIAPKNFVSSVLFTGDEERKVVLGENGITVITEGQFDIVLPYVEVSKVRVKKDYALCYIERDRVLVVKNEGGTGEFEAAVEYLKKKTDRRIKPSEQTHVETENEKSGDEER